MNAVQIVVNALVAVSVVVAAGQRTTFSSRTSGVRLQVGVFDGRGPVHHLTAENFEVFDSKVAQRFSVVETSDAPLDVVVVVQPSYAFAQQAQSVTEQAIHIVNGLLSTDDRIGLLIASAPPVLAKRLGAGQLPRSIDVSEGRLALRDAILWGLTTFDSHDRRATVLILTDGREDTSWLSETALTRTADHFSAQVLVGALERYGSGGVVVASKDKRGAERESIETPQGVGLNIPRYLVELANRSGGRVFGVERANAGEQLTALLTDLRSGYTITYVPLTDHTGGWHDVKVVLKGQRGTVFTRAGYWERD